MVILLCAMSLVDTLQLATGRATKIKQIKTAQLYTQLWMRWRIKLALITLHMHGFTALKTMRFKPFGHSGERGGGGSKSRGDVEPLNFYSQFWKTHSIYRSQNFILNGILIVPNVCPWFFFLPHKKLQCSSGQISILWQNSSLNFQFYKSKLTKFIYFYIHWLFCVIGLYQISLFFFKENSAIRGSGPTKSSLMTP